MKVRYGNVTYKTFLGKFLEHILVNWELFFFGCKIRYTLNLADNSFGRLWDKKFLMEISEEDIKVFKLHLVFFKYGVEGDLVQEEHSDAYELSL